MKLSDYVMDFIASTGTDHVFLLPGGGCMHLIDSIGKSSLTPICCLHEQAAVIAADAYSQYTQNMGVALVTTGPGATNAITGVAGAYIDSTPLLVISGQVKTSDRNPTVRQMGMQEVDIVSMVSPITKYAVTITDQNSIRYHLQKAIHYSKTGRPGPVWIDIPLDIQAAEINPSQLKPYIPSSFTRLHQKPSLQEKATHFLSLLSSSQRPVLLIGNGARSSPNLIPFITSLSIPILTTWKAADLIPESHPLFYGRPGIIGQRQANIIQQKADLFITIGARLDFGQIGYNHSQFAPNAKKVVLDIDENEINKLKTHLTLPINASVNEFIEIITKNKRKCESIDINYWINLCTHIHNHYSNPIPPYSDSINTYHLINVLSHITSPTDIIVPDSSGSAAEITLQSFRVKEGQRIIFNPGLGSMGYGLPQAIGAAIASSRRTISIIGDGSLQHNIQELETLRRLDLPVKLFILNNNGYASIRNTHNTHFDGRLVCCDPSSGLTLPSTTAIAKAYGIPAFKLSHTYDTSRVIKKMFEHEGPAICEVLVDPSLQTQPRITSTIHQDGSITSNPFDDLQPLLPREEYDNLVNL